MNSASEWKVDGCMEDSEDFSTIVQTGFFSSRSSNESVLQARTEERRWHGEVGRAGSRESERERKRERSRAAPHTYCLSVSSAADWGLTIHRKTNKLLSASHRDQRGPPASDPRGCPESRLITNPSRFLSRCHPSDRSPRRRCCRLCRSNGTRAGLLETGGLCVNLYNPPGARCRRLIVSEINWATKPIVNALPCP